MKIKYQTLATLLLVTLLLPFHAKGAIQSEFIGYFDALQAVGPIHVDSRCHPDSAGMVRYDNESGIDLRFSIRKGKLTIATEDEPESVSTRPRITVYSDFLTEASADENASINVHLAATMPQFSANVTGNGSVTVEGLNATSVKASLSTGNGTLKLYGTTVTASYTLVGTGAIEGTGLRADMVKCMATGSGSIGCWALDNLDVKGLGSTKIYYKGTPDIKKLGNNKIFPLTAASMNDNSEEEAEDEYADEEDSPFIRAKVSEADKRIRQREESAKIDINDNIDSQYDENSVTTAPEEIIVEEETIVLGDDEPTVVEEDSVILKKNKSKDKNPGKKTENKKRKKQSEEKLNQEVSDGEENTGELPGSQDNDLPATKKKEKDSTTIGKRDQSEKTSADNDGNPGHKVAKKRLSKRLTPKTEPSEMISSPVIKEVESLSEEVKEDQTDSAGSIPAINSPGEEEISGESSIEEESDEEEEEETEEEEE